MCFILIHWLVFLIMELLPILNGQTTQVSIFLIMPDRAKLNGNLKTTFSEAVYTLGTRVFRKSPIYSNLRLKQYSTIIDKENPREILDMFCETIFKSHVNTILYFQLHPTKDPTPKFIINMAEYLRIPVISWDPQYPGALQHKQESTVLQMAPTIYHQCAMMLDILKRFNWTNFAIVSTTTFNNLEFTGSIDILIKEHNTKVKYDRKRRFNLLSSIVVNLRPLDNDTVIKTKSREALLKHNNQENRVFLIHVREAKDILEVADELGLTGKEYIWIMSSFCLGNMDYSRPPRAYPLGSLGVTYSSISKDGFEDQLIDDAMKTSVRLWVETLKKTYTNKDQYKISPNFSCLSQQPLQQWMDGEKFYRVMRNVRLDRPTPVQFSNNGVNQLVKLRIVNIQQLTENHKISRVWKEVGRWVPIESNVTHKAEMIVEMSGITWPGNAVLPPLGKPEKRFMRIVTLKEKPYVFYLDKDANGKCPPPAVPCRLMKKINPAYDNSLQNRTVSRCCAGLCIDILRVLSSRMQFDYELYEVPDQTWGLPDQQTGEWNGLIKQIQDGLADMVLTSLKITPKRSEVVDFSIPFLETGITIMVSIRKGNISPTAFLDTHGSFYWFFLLLFTLPIVAFFIWLLEIFSQSEGLKTKVKEPYDYPSWCVILVFSVHVTGAAIFIYEWLSPRGLNRGATPLREHRFSLFRSFWLIWAMLFGASVSTDNPRGVSSRFLSNVWALFALVFLASYTANLAAFMITKDEYYNLSGIKDWRLTNPYFMNPPFKFATIPNGSTEENLRKNHYNMYKYMQRYNRPTVDDAVKALKQGKIQAFIYDATPLEYHTGNDDNCELKTVGEKYAMTGYGIAVPQKKAKHLEEINEVILELQENGELERLRRFWLAGACHVKRKRGQSSHTIGIPNFTSAFILLASGVLLGGLVLLMEHLYFKFGRRCLRKYDKNMCCSLVSLSMGRSLTFEQSVMKALARQKHNECKNPRCEVLLWKERHNHDLSLLYINKLKEQLQSYGITPEEDPMKQLEICDTFDKHNGYPTTCQFLRSPFKSIENRHECHQLDSYDSTPVRWKRRSLKRSPSYTNAVEVPVPEISEKQKVRFNEGKFYYEVDNEGSDQETL